MGLLGKDGYTCTYPNEDVVGVGVVGVNGVRHCIEGSNVAWVLVNDVEINLILILESVEMLSC